MDDNAIKLVYTNRDAIATNRGFYFQYLNLLKKWVQNFIENNGKILHSEVGDDIRESGEELVFTQLKCYSSSFSLNSKEIKNALYIFFLNFLREQKNNVCVKFVFETNTGIIKKEKLLKNWIENYPLAEGDLKNQCNRRIEHILSDEIKKARGNKLKNIKKNSDQANEVNDAYNQLLLELNNKNLLSFVGSISWCFSDQRPEISIQTLVKEIQQLLENRVFANRSPIVIMNVLLSEIYRRSQNIAVADRELNCSIMKELLESTDAEFENKIDERVSVLFREELEPIYIQIESLKKEQIFHAEKLKELDNKVNNWQFSVDLPKDLTLNPTCNTVDLVPRDIEIEELNRLLSEKKHISINGVGGTGKSTVSKLYLQKYYDKYDHIIWLNADLNLFESIKLNDVLCGNLRIEIKDLSNEDLLNKFVLALNQIPGNNLMLIDNANNDEALLGQLRMIRSWNILASSRVVLKNFTAYKLPVLGFDDAEQIFAKHVSDPVDKSTLSEFFTLVGYNTLLIELVAKTIQNSLDLNLQNFIDYLKNQELDNFELEIDIELEDTAGNVQLFSFLQKTFELSDITDEERYLLDFFALLPSEIDLRDLIDMAGSNNKKENTPYFLNMANKLSQKGWLERDKNKIRIHRMIQETSIYRQRKENAPFQSCMFFLDWLIGRFKEGFLTTPATSLRFYKYGISILDSIKEPYRQNLYQPLLHLENEVLNVDNMLLGNQDTFLKWQDLDLRATAYLPGNDPILGIIHMNSAMSFFRKGDDDRGIELSYAAIEILQKNLPLALHPLVNAMTNLSIIHSQNDRFDEALKLLKEMHIIREKYDMKNDPSAAAASNALGLAYQRSGNYEKSTAQFKLAVRMHQAQDQKYKNDAYLLSILNNLSISLFLEKKHEESVANQIAALKIANNLKIYNTKPFRETLDTLYSLYIKLGKKEEAEALKIIYEGKYF